MRAHNAIESLGGSVRVGAYDIAIEVWENREGALRNAAGEYCASSETISISRELASPVTVVDTLTHEITHAIFWVYGVGAADSEERIVTALGSAWTQVYRDNPWLLIWIAKALA